MEGKKKKKRKWTILNDVIAYKKDYCKIFAVSSNSHKHTHTQTTKFSSFFKKKKTHFHTLFITIYLKFYHGYTLIIINFFVY